MVDLKQLLDVPPSQALADVIGFVWHSEGFEVLSLRNVKKEDVYSLKVVAFLDYVMVVVEIEFLDGWAIFHDLSAEESVVFHHFVHRVVSSCFSPSKDNFPEGSSIADFKGQQHESLEWLEVQASLLLRQVTGILGNSKADQLDAARTLARCAKEPQWSMVIGFETAKLGDAVAGVIKRSLPASTDLATLEAIYPFLDMLKSVSCHPAGANFLLFLLPLQSLTCIRDCSLLMRTFRELLNQISERASLQEAVKEEKPSSFTPSTFSRAVTASTEFVVQSRTHTSSSDYQAQSRTSTSSQDHAAYLGSPEVYTSTWSPT